MLKRLIILIFLTASTLRAEPVVTGVLHSNFADIADLALRDALQSLPQVDQTKYPQISHLFANTIALTQRLVIPEDGTRPIRVVFVDDMSPNLGFARTTKGPHVLLIHLGALQYFKEDGELAYTIGHELEHSLSRLNEESREQHTNSKKDFWKALNADMINRVAENEVDVKSVFRRVHKKGYSPYSAIHLIERMIHSAGDATSATHTKLSNRRNTIELELVGMSRLLGEKRNHTPQTDVLTPAVQEYFGSQDFLSMRMAEASKVSRGFDQLAEDFVLAVKAVETATSVDEQKEKQRIADEKLAELQRWYKKSVVQLDHHLNTIAPDQTLLDEQLKLRAAVARALRTAREKYFPDLQSIRKSRQFSLLRKAAQLDFRSKISDHGQGGPLEDLLDAMDRTEREYQKLGTDAEARSRKITLDRKSKRQKAELELILSGYSDPQKALALARQAMRILDDALIGGMLPVEYKQAHQELAFLHKHQGQESKAREDWVAENNSRAADIYLNDPHFDPLELMTVYQSLPKQRQREVMPVLLPRYLKIHEERLRAAKSDAEYLDIHRGASRIFAFGYSTQWDLRDELNSNLATTAHVRDYFRTLIATAPSGDALQKVLPEISTDYSRENIHRINIGRMADFDDTRGGQDTMITMNATAAKLIYDAQMIKDELDRSLHTYQDKFAATRSKSLPDFLSVTDLLIDQTDRRLTLLDLADQPDFQDRRLGAVMKAAEAATPEHIRQQLPNWREVIRAATHLRLYKLKQKLSKQQVSEILATLEKSIPHWQGDSEVAQYLGKALSLDGWAAFQNGKDATLKDTFRIPIKHPEIFVNGKGPLTKDDQVSLKVRKELLSQIWKVDKVRDRRLEDIYHLLNLSLSGDDDTPQRHLGPGYFDEIWREQRSSPQTVEDFTNLFEPVLRNAPSIIPQLTINSITETYRLSDVQTINLAEAVRRVHLRGLKYSSEKTINDAVSQDAKKVFAKRGIQGRLSALPPLERARHLILTTINRTGPDSDSELDEVLKVAAGDPGAKALLMDPSIVQNFYYEVTRRNFALWQLQQKFQLDSIEARMKAGHQPPTTHQRRQIVSEIQQWVDRQFPRNQPLKDTVLNTIEDKVLSSPAESQQLASSRLTFANWERLPEIVLVDLPEIINENIQSSFDRMQLLEYFTGVRKAYPQFIQKAEAAAAARKLHGELVTTPSEVVADLRVRFVSSPVPVRTAMLQSLLDQDFGVLSEAETEVSLKKMILGKNYDNKLFRTLFETYLESLPKAERKPVYGAIVSSMADAPKGTAGVSLKTVLEAMGPFGIKAGQFLRTSGLLSEEAAAGLDDFLDRALPPDRSRIANDLQQRFGENLAGFELIRNLVGSGSINYVVRVDFKTPVDGEKSAVIRIRRPKIEGQVHNENELWTKVAEKIRPDDPEVAEIIEEARGHTFETLKEGGTELDLSIEVKNKPVAEQAYARKITSGAAHGFEISVGHPLKGFEKLLLPNQQAQTAVYRYVDATPLDEITDPILRAALAEQIVESELRAIFEKGVFDPDGHPGNWLVDLKNKRLVRIDYAQLRTLGDHGESFRKVFKELVSTRPNFANPVAAQALAELLKAEGISTADLQKAIRLVAPKVQFSKARIPQQRLFDLRRALRRELGVNISSRDELRSGLAAIAKVRGFERFLPAGDFNILVAKHSKLAIAKPLLWMKAVRDWMKGDKRVPPPRIKQKNPEPEPLRPETLKALSALSEVSALDPAASFRNSPAQKISEKPAEAAREESVFKLETLKWSPSSRDEVRLITPDEFDRLPLGTELYTLRGNERLIKGVDDFDMETRNGNTFYGLRGAEAEDLGGFRVLPLQLSPPSELNLDGNPYYTSGNHVRYTVLTPEQYDSLPPHTVLFDVKSGKGFIKGEKPTPSQTLHDHFAVGFPDNTQRGYEGFGTDACHKYYEALAKPPGKE